MSTILPFAGLSSKIKQAYHAAIETNSVLFTESETLDADDESTGIPVSGSTASTFTQADQKLHRIV